MKIIGIGQGRLKNEFSEKKTEEKD